MANLQFEQIHRTGRNKETKHHRIVKILIISYFFPPLNQIGSLRVGKMAKYFRQFGHDVRVITNRPQSQDMSAPLEIPPEHCIYTEALSFEQTIDESYHNHSTPGKLLSRLKRAVTYQKASFLLPNSSWSWYGEAVEKGKELHKTWKPDLIYSSALPISSHFIARKISVTYKIPWVAEYRDLWSGGHGARVSNTHSLFLKRIEKWLLKPVSGLITVSQPLAAYLRAVHKKKVEVVFNGFDTNRHVSKQVERRDRGGKLTIVYTGSIYEGRDPGILFEAIQKLGEEQKKIEVHFYTSDQDKLQKLIKRFELEDCVTLMDYVPYDRSLQVQSEADLLLYLSYSSKTHEGKGILSGKVFEYLGAARPILSVGADSNHLLVQQGFMVHIDDPDELKTQLLKWIDEKEKTGSVMMSGDLSSREIYSREEQTGKADKFIHSLLESQ